MQRTDLFSYIDVMDRAADASWLRNQAISNNIANATTPGYKRQDVSFETELQHALRDTRYESMDAKVSHINPNDIEPTVYTDAISFSYRLDGNNVDIDTENVYLAENQIKYNALVDSIQKDFSMLASVMK